jgi:hypothetical protein
MRCRALASAALDGGPPGLSFVDFPSAEGLLQTQGMCGATAAAHQRYIFVVVFVNGVLRSFVVFFLLSQDLSVRTLC